MARSDVDPVESFIVEVRGQQVMLDSDLAKLYGVTTGRFNEAVKRNIARFPKDFSFVLTRQEYDNLISQNAISTERSAHGGRRTLPRVFTEHGALMAANILKSRRAIEMSLFVIRAFVRLRELGQSNQLILKRLAEIDSTLVLHDKALRDLYTKLLPMLIQEAPKEAPRKRIGFRTSDDE